MNAYSGGFFQRQPARRNHHDNHHNAECSPPTTLHRAIFISDTHLGTPGCKAAMLADFLARNDCRTLYLVGDIIDGWQLRKWYWDDAHRRVIDEILFKAASGTRVIYIAGNHDESLRAYAGLTLAGIELHRDAIHQTADGRRILVIHGDQFDSILTYARWLARFGDTAYSLALQLNDGLFAIRKLFGLPYWSLSQYLKTKVKNAVQFISDFEQAVVRAAGAAGVHGVICGHIHHPVIQDIGGILYCNDGDWVENCTALVEDMAGEIGLIHWTGYPTGDGVAPRPNLTAPVTGDRLPQTVLST